MNSFARILGSFLLLLQLVSKDARHPVNRAVVQVLRATCLIFLAIFAGGLGCLQAQNPPELFISLESEPQSKEYGTLFNLTIDSKVVAYNVASGAMSTSTTFGPYILSQGPHVVSETAGTGTNLANYVVKVGQDCHPVKHMDPLHHLSVNNEVVLALGDQKTCSITNLGPSDIRIFVSTNALTLPDAGTFTVQIVGGAASQPFTLGKFDHGAELRVSPGTYKVEQLPGPGTSVQNYTTFFVNDCAPDGTVRANPGSYVLCAIYDVVPDTSPPYDHSEDSLFVPPPGAYQCPLTVTIHDDPNHSSGFNGNPILFTTDGSTPTVHSELYTAPITVNNSETIKTVLVGVPSPGIPLFADGDTARYLCVNSCPATDPKPLVENAFMVAGANCGGNTQTKDFSGACDRGFVATCLVNPVENDGSIDKGSFSNNGSQCIGVPSGGCTCHVIATTPNDCSKSVTCRVDVKQSPTVCKVP